MRKRTMAVLPVLLLILVLLSGCGGRELADMEGTEADGRYAVAWEGRTYYPFCVVSKGDCGAQLGYVNGDKDDRVYEYLDYPPESWLVNALTMDGGALLLREAAVTDIPDGLTAEYDQS